ncbi:hypothetical protein [Wandonia haliotis]
MRKIILLLIVVFLSNISFGQDNSQIKGYKRLLKGVLLSNGYMKDIKFIRHIKRKPLGIELSLSEQEWRDVIVFKINLKQDSFTYIIFDTKSICLLHSGGYESKGITEKIDDLFYKILKSCD